MGTYAFEELKMAVANIRHFVARGGDLAEHLERLSHMGENLELSNYEKVFLVATTERLLRDLRRLSQSSQ